MLLVLDDIHKKHLDMLKGIDDKVVKEFCRISAEHLRKGSNIKVYQNAAQKLNVETDVVQNAVIGIMHLLTEASKIMISELEFRDSIIMLGFSEQSQEELVRCYLENREDIRNLLHTLNITTPQYHNLEWRVDIQIASRSLRKPIEPSLLMKLQLQKGNKINDIILESDPTNLIHMTEVLDQALQEVKSQHCRRIMRSVK